MSLKESIEGKLNIPTRIRMGGPGALDVFVDKQRIYSKNRLAVCRRLTRSLTCFAPEDEV